VSTDNIVLLIFGLFVLGLLGSASLWGGAEGRIAAGVVLAAMVVGLVLGDALWRYEERRTRR
jgi:hypothetical protein